MFVTTFARTPFARVHGALSGYHPAELLSLALTGLALEVPPTTNVLVGCAQPVGAQGSNVGRAATLLAGWNSTGAAGIAAGANSSHQALHLAVSSANTTVVAGVELMSLVPDGASDLSRNYGPGWGPAKEQFAERGGLVPFGVASDRVAEAHGLSRSELDVFAAQQRSTVAGPPPMPVTERTDDREATPAGGAERDADDLAAVPIEAPPLHDDEGTTAATNITPAADGAVALVVEPHPGDTPLARIVHTATHAGDPLAALDAPGVALRAALQTAGWSATDLARIEYDAPSAAAALVLQHQCGVPVHTSAFARGRPTGASALAALGHLATTLAPGDVGALLTVSTDGTAAVTLLERPS
ncbi:MAG: hypothetical protein HKN26_12210 [Acidimicrobiales bacterium]|nr:hypothetical protein [Acidimicrobiales bacterium]